jgi:trimethylamine--corrinoid protein Co-methyltransferase
LSDAQLQKIHQTSLEILERVGVAVADDGAVTLLKKGGARVSDGNIVKYPPHLVEWAIRSAPKQFAMCDRFGNKAMAVGGFNSYYGTGSDCPYVIDHRTRQRREGRLSDVVEGMWVCESLDNIDFVMSMFIPFDVPTPISDRYQMEAMLLNTRKPILFVTHDLQGAKDAVEMAEVVAGGADTLREKPQVCCFVNINAPLEHNTEAVQKMMYMAHKGLPCTCSAPMSTRGITTPVTMAATLALNNAGQLAGLVLSQLVREGAPQVPCRTGGGGLDMRTMVALYASPEMQGFRGDLAHFYGLPTFGMAGCSDSKAPDEQALAEASLTLIVDTLVGSNLIHDVGYLESGRAGSLEMLTMCDDVIGWVRRFVEQPAIVDNETLALDVIEKAGPLGGYIESEHTLRHCREDWYPKMMDRRNISQWQERGGKTYRERACEHVEQVLQKGKRLDLGQDVPRGIRAVLERAPQNAGVALEQ